MASPNLTNQVSNNAKDITYLKESVGKIDAKIGHIEQSVTNLSEKFDEKLRTQYVSQDQFFPVKLMVYGMAAGCLSMVLGALLALVIGVKVHPIDTDIQRHLDAPTVSSPQHE